MGVPRLARPGPLAIRLPLRWHLALLVVVALVPVVAFSLIMVALFHGQQRGELEAAQEQAARSLSLAVDRELAGMLTTMEALSSSELLRRGDLAAFYRQCLEVQIKLGWDSLGLADASGQLRFSVVVPYGTPLPSVAHRDYYARMLETRRPVISDLVFAPRLERQVVVVTVPVFRLGELHHVLMSTLSTERLARILADQGLPDDRRVVLFDRQGRVLARHPAPGPGGGAAVAPAVAAASRAAAAGTLRDRDGDGDGVAVYRSFNRSPLSGWTVSLGVPAAAVDGRLRHTLWTMGGAGLLFLVVGAALATAVGRRIAAPIVALADAAGGLGQGDRPRPLPASSVHEVETAGRAIERAGHLLHERGAARDEIEQVLRQREAQLRLVTDALPALVAYVDTEERYRFLNRGYEEWFGRPRRAYLGRRVSEVLGGTAYADVRPHVAAALAGREVTFEARLDHGLAGPRFVRATYVPDRAEDGSVRGYVALVVDMTERKRAEEALGASEERYRSLVEGSIQGIIIHRDWTVQFANQSVARMLGFDAPEGLVGTDVRRVIAPEERPRIEGYAAARRRGEAVPEQYEFRALRKDGTPIWIESQVSAITWDGVAAVLTTSLDISDRKRAEQERAALLERERRARAEAEEANRAKDEFLAMLSHELRTPLTAMLGWVRMLRTTRLEGEQAERALEVIERNTRLQARLINDLLDVSRIVAGKLQLDSSAVDLLEVVEQAVEAVRREAEAKPVALRAALDPDAGPVWGDPVRLQQVVVNLLSNAVKFTRAGGQVDIGLERAAGRARITVRDTGEGIDPAVLPHVFDRFRQADSTTTRGHGGLGLGLAIVRHLVGLHGGAVRAESKGRGTGAAFTVDLPALRLPVQPPAANGDADADDAGTGGSPLGGVHVLVVDDHADSRALLDTMLTSAGARVRVAATLEDALAALDGEPIDVLVSDLAMPEGDGYDLIRRVRAREGERRGARLPAIALTAYAAGEDRRRALASGFDEHAAKPVERRLLVDLIARMLAAERAGRRPPGA